MTHTPSRIGIHDLTYATAHNVLDLREIADHYGQDVNKFYVGIGQSQMSVPAEDEDVVTIGAAAARRIIDRHGVDGIRTVLFATESGIDQSKSAGVYVHGLLGLPENCRSVELKQACYSGTAALQFALGIVARDPSERVLVIAADIARYAIGSSGEATQGAAAAAYLVTADPALVEIEPISGVHTDDIHDFWRPNYRSAAVVDGKYSLAAYLSSLEGAWAEYRARGGVAFEEIDRFCYHQPFTKMAVKAHDKLSRLVGSGLDADGRRAQIAASLDYNRVIGNSYTASVYLGLLSLLDNDTDDNDANDNDANDNDADDLSGKRIGFFSYGSGSVSEFFTGVVQPGYRQLLRADENQRMLEARTPIDYARYAELHAHIDAVQGHDHQTARQTAAPYRFVGVRDHIRGYEARA